ncbi:septation protein IspZ [Cupriavidus gilardii]
MSLWPWGGIGADLELLKPTIVFVTYAVIFIIIDSLLQASPLQLVFGWRLQLSIQEWRELSFGMSALMSVIAAINFLVASISTTLCGTSPVL